MWIEELPAYSLVKVPITASTLHMRDGSVLVNNLGAGRVNGFTLEVPPSLNVTTQVYDLLIDGVVWFDSNGDGVQDDGEPLLSHVTIELVNEQGFVVRTVQTDENGAYHFGQGLRPDGAHPGFGTDSSWYLEDGAYTTRVVRDDGVVLSEWRFTHSGGDANLDGTSASLHLGRESIDDFDFAKYQRADFGLFNDTYYLTWTKVSENGAPLTGATFEVTGESGETFTVTDNDARDLDPAHGVLKVIVAGVGHYTVSETVAPQGYSLTTEVLSGTVKPGVVETNLGELLNTRLADPEPEPGPGPEPSPTPTPPVAKSGQGLPVTGADLTGVGVLAAMLIAVGGIIALRRPRSNRR